MPAYVIATVEVKDPVAYQEYIPLAAASVHRHGGRFLVRGGASEVMEGDALGGRLVVAEFPSYEQALAWYKSDDYQAALPIRQRNSVGSLVIVDGYDDQG